jgi:hypothetical protein
MSIACNTRCAPGRRGLAAIAALLVAALAAPSGGCATTWLTMKVSGAEPIWDEGVREEVVPLPGLEEQLVIGLPLSGASKPDASQRSDAAAAAQPTPAPPTPLALTCRSQQRGRDAVYHQAFRYGSRWKKQAAVAFLLEGLVAAALLLDDSGSTDRQIEGIYFGVDALATAGLFFLPRQEIYRRDERPVTTAIRTDCPDGLVVEIAGTDFAVDAAGQLGEEGELALDAWMTSAPSSALRVRLAGQAADLVITAEERCAWSAHHHPGQPLASCPYTGPRPTLATAAITVSPGTLSRAD